jgi:hypothetical protein
MGTARSTEQFAYLSTTGGKTELLREIEIWFVERDGKKLSMPGNLILRFAIQPTLSGEPGMNGQKNIA